MLRFEVTLSQAWLVSSSPPDGPEEITAEALTGEGLTAKPCAEAKGPEIQHGHPQMSSCQVLRGRRRPYCTGMECGWPIRRTLCTGGVNTGAERTQSQSGPAVTLLFHAGSLSQGLRRAPDAHFHSTVALPANLRSDIKMHVTACLSPGQKCIMVNERLLDM
ncbi:hypothetical protein SKAU_G00235100 [Synaphobranchus kaupii]|uniref:Uncharacterized protein n=1 Tax=Synaphobranchus kaupii TaxID=118154 RepID=A0A9Q1F6V3_SYNKA|nr:hypothetical protein SKAU_G00235100 [Synaphobranchus kaupii]